MANSQILSRQQYKYIAKVAEQVHRYKDMMNYMNNLVNSWVSFDGDLDAEERKLLLTAYKNVIGSLRYGLQVVQREECNKNGNAYKSRLEDEISDVCNTILKLLDEILIPCSSSSESDVFYLKMRGDYQRYLAEFKVGDDRKNAADGAIFSYKKAESVALVMRPSHPMRLGLALNFSVFYYEILNESEIARSRAEAAYYDAIEDEISLPEELQKESTQILQLIRENLTRWEVQNK